MKEHSMEKAESEWEDGVDLIRHLIEVESDAASLALEASEEADKRRHAAKQKADAEYHGKYEELIASLEAWLNSEKEACDAEQKAIVAEHEKRLNNLAKDLNTFHSFVDSVLIGK